MIISMIYCIHIYKEIIVFKIISYNSNCTQEKKILPIIIENNNEQKSALTKDSRGRNPIGHSRILLTALQTYIYKPTSNRGEFKLFFNSSVVF